MHRELNCREYAAAGKKNYCKEDPFKGRHWKLITNAAFEICAIFENSCHWVWSINL